MIKRLAWYSTEFGLVMEDNRIKVFGAGMISGRSELANTIMEFYRLDRDDVLDYRGDVFAQIQEQFMQMKRESDRISPACNRLHQQGADVLAGPGLERDRALYDKLGIAREVILAAK